MPQKRIQLRTPLLNRGPRVSLGLIAVAVLLSAAIFGAVIKLNSRAAAPGDADLNGDGNVGITDLSMLLSRWGTADPAADINDDGTVSITDLSILLSSWGSVATAPGDGSYDEAAFIFAGTWATSTGAGKYLGGDKYSSTPGSTYSFTFSGTQAHVYAAKASHHGIMAVSIDGGAEMNVDLYSSARADQVRVYGTPTLPAGTHTIRVRVTGTKNASASGTTINADRIDVGAAEATPPPVTGGPGRLLWSSGFDGERASYNPEVEDAPYHASFPVPSHAKDGKVLRVKLAQGSDDGYKFGSRFHNAAGAKGKHLGIAPQNEVYLKYDMYIPSSVNLEYRGKLPGLAGLPDSQRGWYTSSGGNMRSDSFSARLHVRPSSDSSVGRPFFDAYLYAWHANGVNYGANGYRYGISTPFTTDASNKKRTGREILIPRDRWFSVQHRIKLNTPGRNDGIYEGWIDGVKGVSLHDVQWRKSGVNTPINQIMAHTFANSPGYPGDGSFDYDNFELRAP